MAWVASEIPPPSAGASQGGSMGEPSPLHHGPGVIVVTPRSCITVPSGSVAPGIAARAAGAAFGACAGWARLTSTAPVPPINVTPTITHPTILAFVQNIIRIAPFSNTETEPPTIEPADVDAM